jgi:hypothetical protein
MFIAATISVTSDTSGTASILKSTSRRASMRARSGSSLTMSASHSRSSTRARIGDP